jgi:shikimate kinase
LILVGLPGAGKSTVGLAVAERLGRTFLDFDAEIERREGMPLSQLFGEKGEPYFRQREHELTDELRVFGNMILAPGGGWIANADSMILLRPPARVVYLKANPPTALKRLGDQRSTRPLLMRPDPVGELKRLLASRKTAYEAADYVVDTERLDFQRVVDKVASLASTLA